MSKSVYEKNRHVFEMMVPGSKTKVKFRVKVRRAKKIVKVVLDGKYVLESKKLDGVGNTMTCPMALDVIGHAKLFPHKVYWVDWSYTRVFIVSQFDKDGAPIECVVYEHNAPWIAKLNDTKGGQDKLLARLDKDGPVIITLSPKRIRSKKGRSGKDRKKVGTRTNHHGLRGPDLRHAVATAGVYPLPQKQAA